MATPMRNPVVVSSPAPELPGHPAGTPGAAAAAQRLRAIDTLLADRGELFQALFLSAPIAKALVELGKIHLWNFGFKQYTPTKKFADCKASR